MCMLAYSSWLRQCIAVAQATVLVCRMEMLLQVTSCLYVPAYVETTILDKFTTGASVRC